MRENYLDVLNDTQREAVLYCDGPSLVIAGAGSGKTRVLTYKIAYLVENGIEPWRILALTFTNKAAKEMKERIATLIGPDKAKRLWMGTFHSVFSRILRSEIKFLDFNSYFTIYDQNDSRNLLKNIIVKDMKLDDKVYKPALISSRISAIKNRLMLPEEYASQQKILKYDLLDGVPKLIDIYRHYMERCKRSNVMDFDDLLLYTYLLFTRHPEICERYAKHFKYVLVDEYQDTNYAQHAIVWLLTKAKQKICVVGDDAQSIYGFRGAEIGNILRFTEEYKGARLFKLEQNYRSTQSIVQAANKIIAYNKDQIQKKVFSENAKGDPVRIYRAYSDLEEADIVCNKINELKAKNSFTYKDFAVLYRTNSQSRVFEDTLRKRLIPYHIYGGLSFYQRKEIKDVLAYFRLAVNPYDEEAVKRIINYPARGIGNTTVQKMIHAAVETGKSLWDILCEPEACHLSVHVGIKNKLDKFKKMIKGFINAASEQDAFMLGQNIIRETGIMNDLNQDASPDGLSKQENIRELINALHLFVKSRIEEEGDSFVSMSDYLSQVSLLTDMDTVNDDSDRVSLMTIHSAKGLEFPTVFIVGVEEGIFPNERAQCSIREMEEERRLFYVAITRAKEFCFLSWAQNRFRYGKMEFCSPSSFLHEIKECEPEDKSILAKRIPISPSLQNIGKVYKTNIDSPENIKPENMSRKNIVSGSLIEHERFGIGEVLNVEGHGENVKATVQFQNSGRKQLLLKFARFKILK